MWSYGFWGVTIPVDVPLPSAGVEITKITLGKDIKIPGVDERTWYLASLPRIRVDDKGKERLMEKDHVKGNPMKEQKLASLKVEDISAKEELVLSWGEAESTRVALNMRMYILTKYRELLITKFLEARKINFTPGDGASAVDLNVLDRLSDIHSFLLEELKEQTKAHGLTWKKTCCSKFFEGRPRDCGAVIARTNTNTPTKCWIRTMIRVDGVWVVEPCSDHWVNIPNPIVRNEVPRQLSFEDTLPANSLFNGLSITDIRSFVSSIVFERTVLRDVQRSSVSVASQNLQLEFSSVVEDEDNQMDIDQRLSSPTTTTDSSMNFSDNDILLGDDETPNQPSLPTVATNLSTYLDDFRTLLWQRLDAQSEDIRHIGASHNDVLSRLTTLDKSLRDALLQQVEDLRKLIQNFRQDGRTLDDVQTLRFNEFRKGFLAHSAAVTADSMDFRKEFRALNAKPPSTTYRGSGNTGGGSGARTTDIVDIFSGSLSREGRGRGSGGSRSRGHSKKRYPSSGGGQFRRSFDDWLG
ncbi:hypothetical protein F511_21281 [Dorcoceras hygrometricum]|uniref:Uncharacterized protein n=1 Tax=Dorcoceras hygrometricum TaxID=472368 RepID=A0A2Z7C7V2_9LAMI|nr:hypothetical protein F511_21281 [Dorcoceras hygrometricum]